MIWFFIITSAILGFVGVVFLVSPQKMLFLFSGAEQQRLMEGRFYRVIARVGGVLLIFLCAPLNLIFGVLFAGLLTTQ